MAENKFSRDYEIVLYHDRAVMGFELNQGFFYKVFIEHG